MSNPIPPLARDTQGPGLFEVLAPPAAAEPAAPASLTYEPYYGLHEKPFSLSADPRFLFKTPAHAPAFDELAAGIRRREGLLVLTGEIGTGKTTLCRAVVKHLDRRTFSTFVPDPFVSREDLLKILLVDFGVMSIDDMKSGRLAGASRPDLSYPLYEFLRSLEPLQAFAVLIVDEAQNLPLSLLEEIRILADLEGSREKLLQVVLIGQPELRAKLKLPEMRQVNQRVTVRCELAPLKATDLAGYITHRLDVASGGGGHRAYFTAEALTAIFRASQGTPRLINLICDRALRQGYLDRASSIDAEMVAKAIQQLDLVESASALAPAVRVEEPQPETPNDPDGVAEFASEDALELARRRAGRRRVALRFAFAAIACTTLTAAGMFWYLVQASDVAGRPGLPSAPVLPAAVGLPAPTPPPVSAAQSDARPASTQIESGAERFVIQVASLHAEARAARLVQELTSAGYRAFKLGVDFGPPRGFLQQVLIGRYSTRADAEFDLKRIRQIPGYDDATIRRVE